MTADIRYCTSADGVRLAYSIDGSGPAVLWSPLIFESMARERMTPNLAGFLNGLRRQFTVIRFDQRGTGLSQRDVAVFSPAVTRLDLEAILSAAAVERVRLLANTGWCSHFLIFAAEHPDMVESVVAWNGQASMEEAMPQGIYESMVQMVRANWPLASRTLADFGGRRLGDEPLHLAESCRLSADAETVAAILESNRQVDAAPLLARIACPVLMLVNEGMMQNGMESAQRLAAAIASSRIAVLEHEEYVLHPSAQGRALEIITEFFGGSPLKAPSPDPRTLRTVLFTDLVGHTEMMQRLGDDRGRAVLREHERLTRDVLKRHDGEEVKTMGDGFMASFSSVTNAIDCAIALQREIAATPLPSPLDGEGLAVRVGLNAGEPIEEEGDLFGATVIIASRVAALGGPGEILIPEPLRHLLAGKNYAYTDRGEVALKGFSEPVRLYEVRWRD